MTVADITSMTEFGKHLSDKNSLTFSWWDFGYPLSFYSGAKTLSDGGRQGGDASFVESSILISPAQGYAARLMREIAENGSFEMALKNAPIVNNSMDPNIYQTALFSNNFPSHKKTKEAYLVLPSRMVPIFGTIAKFGNLNLVTGKPFVSTYYNFQASFSEDNATVKFPDGSYFDKTSKQFVSSGVNIPVHSVFSVGSSDSITSPVFIQGADFGVIDGANIILDNVRGCALICSDALLESVFVQMFFFNRYDQNYFEAVVSNPMIKIYRLKI
jgi:undecaprenyl-diphosphooligosaccharide---protein glycotransferase